MTFLHINIPLRRLTDQMKLCLKQSGCHIALHGHAVLGLFARAQTRALLSPTALQQWVCKDRDDHNETAQIKALI